MPDEPAVFVQLSDQTKRRVAVDKLQVMGANLLRADDQDVLTVQPEQVGTFPHPADPVFGCGDLTDKAPMERVVAFKQKYGAATVGGEVAHHG